MCPCSVTPTNLIRTNVGSFLLPIKFALILCNKMKCLNVVCLEIVATGRRGYCRLTTGFCHTQKHVGVILNSLEENWVHNSKIMTKFFFNLI